MVNKKIRILISKVGLDYHTRGVKIVSTALRDAGMEVVYLGGFQTTKGIVKAALQEDVGLIGISCHCGEHLTLVPEIIELLKENKEDDIPVIVGGAIPKEDIPELKLKGVREVYLTGTKSEEMANSVKQLCKKQ